MIVYPVGQNKRALILFVTSIAGIFALTITLYWLLVQPAMPELQRFALAYGMVAGVAAALGIWGFYLEGSARLPRFVAGEWRAYALVGLLIYLGSAVAAGIFFQNIYDLILSLLVTAFVVAILMALAFLKFATYRNNLQALTAAAESLARGRYHVAVELSGQSDLVQLGTTFNNMAAKMEGVDQKERHLDRMRLDLTTWIGYDLRIPLTSVRNSTEALADDLVEDPRIYRRYLAMAERDVNMLSDLIDDLYDMAQLETVGIRLVRRPSDIGQLIEETVAGLSDMAGEMGVMLSGSTAPEVKEISVDRIQLSRAFNNLIRHALRRTPQGGSVSIHAYAVAGGVLIEIVDVFQGARSGEVDHLLELFFDENYPRGSAANGVRLGLAMAKTIVQAHGSQLRVENTTNQGMRVLFTLTEDASISTFERGM